MKRDIEIQLTKELDSLLRDLPEFMYEYSIRNDEAEMSLRTKLAYIRDIKTFLEYISDECLNKDLLELEIFDLENITEIDIRNYIAYIKEYNKSFKNKKGEVVNQIFTNTAAGISRKVAVLKSFYNFMIERKWIKFNPLLTIKAKPPKYIGIRERLNAKEVVTLEKTVLEGINVKTSLSEKAYERNRARDTAIMLIFLYSGIRVSELASLDIKDVNIDNSTLSIIRKNGKIDKIPFPDVIADYINISINERKSLQNIESKALFISQFKKRITTRSINNIVKKYAERANITKEVTPHTLRRTFLTAFYNSTRDIELTRRIAGHECVETTRKFYSSSSDDRFEDEIHKFSY